MIINIKGIGRVSFPDGMSPGDIQEALNNNFGKDKEREKEEKAEKLENIKAIVKGVVSDTVKTETIVPDVNVAPKVEVKQEKVDLTPVVSAIDKLADKPEKELNVTIEDNRGGSVKIEVVEWTQAGTIKALICKPI